MASIPASPRPVGTFDAARWIAEWTEHGGIYIVAGDQLHLRRVRPLDLYLDALPGLPAGRSAAVWRRPSGRRRGDPATERPRSMTDPVDFLLRAALRLERPDIARLTEGLIAGLDVLDGDRGP